MLAHSYYIIVQKNKSSKKRRMLQLRWNNYYFVQNLYFDDKIWRFQVKFLSVASAVARVRSQYEVTRAEQDSAQSLATYTDLSEHLLSSSSQCSWWKKLNLDWGIWNLKLRAKFKLFKDFSFYCRSTSLEWSSSSFNLAVIIIFCNYFCKSPWSWENAVLLN